MHSAGGNCKYTWLDFIGIYDPISRLKSLNQFYTFDWYEKQGSLQKLFNLFQTIENYLTTN